MGVKQLFLTDASEKQIGTCNVGKIIFSLSGKQTFYERYGFTNPGYTRLIEQLKGVEVGDLLKSNPQLTVKLSELGLNGSSTLKDTCTKIIEACHSQKNLSENLLAKTIAETAETYLVERDKNTDTFTRPIIKNGGRTRKRQATRRTVPR